MTGETISELLRELQGPSASAAWARFLEAYSSVIQQVIVVSVEGAEDRADCFVYVCEGLAAKCFHRLSKFDPNGTASFSTWLRAVVRNLCLDCLRQVHGRFQPFEWAKSLPPLDQEIFRRVYEQGCTVEETHAALSPVSPGLRVQSVEEIAERLGSRLSHRERWLLTTRQTRVHSLDCSEGDDQPCLAVPDPRPDPEAAAINAENKRQLARAMRHLNPQDRLILQLRFEQDLTLEQIAPMIGVKDAQSADRRIRLAVEQLKHHVPRSASLVGGKITPASV